jgi:hypothetical protein
LETMKPPALYDEPQPKVKSSVFPPSDFRPG